MFLKNSFYNIIATAAYIGAQQIIIFHHISNISEVLFSDAILVITIINVFTYVTSASLGRTMLMRSGFFKKNNEIPFDYIVFMFYFIGLVFAVTLCFSIVYSTVARYFSLCLLTCLSLVRTFYSYRKKLKMNFSFVMSQNLLYLIGGTASCFLLNEYIENIYYYFIIPELLSSLIYVIDYDEFKCNYEISNHFKEVKTTFFNFSFQTFLSNIISYFDRFLIVPILGTDALAVYFAATVLSKCTMLLTGPINDVIASILSNTSSKSRIKVFEYLKDRTKKYFVLFLFVNLLLSYMCMYFVYNQYFYKGIIVVAIMSISATTLIFSEFYQLAFMRFINSKVLTYISFVRVVIACIVSFVLSKYYGVAGYSAGIALSNIVTLIVFVCLSLVFSKDNALSKIV